MSRSFACTLVCTISLACARPVPAHLRVPVEEEGASDEAPVTDLTSAIASTIGRDPLARSPRLLSDEVLGEVSGTGPLITFNRAIRSLERGEGAQSDVLRQLEDEWRGTVVVALSRGYRLGLAENLLGSSAASDPSREDRLLSLLSPLRLQESDEGLAMSAMAWLGEDPSAARIRDYGDRWVLLGWLADPSLPLEPVGEQLGGPQYEALRETPVGALVLARARAAEASPADDGLADLRRATQLALEEAAADRDREQADWAKVKAEVGRELQSDDPIGALLARARRSLTAQAGEERAAGGALLAIAAERWRGTCGKAPCTGVDRAQTMQAASRWHADLATLSAVWQVVALKHALDTLEVGRETSLFSGAMVDLVDALTGTGSGPLPAQLLRRRSGGPEVWLAVSQAVGGDDVVDWAGARASLGQHLRGLAERALELTDDAELAPLLERIERRAIP